MMIKSFKESSKIAFVFGLVLSGVSVLSAAPVSAGSLVLVGGSLAFPDPDSESLEEEYGISIYREIVDLAGGTSNAKIGIFSTASGNPARSARAFLGDFAALYGDDLDVEWIPVTRDTCSSYKNDSNSAIANQIRDRNAFFFTGGDQSFITDCFFNEDPIAQTRTDTALIQALRDQFAAGAVIAGTSAGTAVQPVDPMVTNGETYEALRDGSVSFVGSPPFDNTLYYNPLGGLGFFEYGLLDSHFSERGRQGRIIRLASDLGVDRAFGVDENTALIVTNTGTPDVNFEVLGQGGVFISDLTSAEVGEKDGYWTISGVTATYLTEGDQYNPLTNTATFENKTSLTGREQLDSVPLEENIFSCLDEEGDWTNPRGFTDTAIALFNSRSTEVIGQSCQTDPIYQANLGKPVGEGFFGTDSQGVTRYSFQNLDIDIAPAPEPGTVLALLGIGAFGAGSLLKRKR
ncbi:cyanophycinase [Oscillatoria sp. FACHB-1407]|uniref:cyanophycinase n=1 Tax=Oscillatoria sp. FACHB-1407 TaxID=2692847 RepID=UPI0016883E16|nr:cyanophycinase [Oscillatoria sp. FACHB-1407]MBD2460333.1 cyanophycinase [Oscillatoria sp. FACHB-1407]